MPSLKRGGMDQRGGGGKKKRKLPLVWKGRKGVRKVEGTM